MQGVIFDRPMIILCEGHGDRRFLETLLLIHGLTDITVCVPYKDATGTQKGYRGGVTNFGDYTPTH